MSDPKDGGNTAPVYNSETHRAGLQALRGQPYTGASYAAPPVIPEDTRSPELKAHDEKYGQPSNPRNYDLGQMAPEGLTAADTVAGLQALDMPASTGRSLVEAAVVAAQEYARLDDAGKALWLARQEYTGADAADVVKMSAASMAALTAAAPAFAKSLLVGGKLPVMVTALLANQSRSLTTRTAIRGAA
jgi:hypothetical protein